MKVINSRHTWSLILGVLTIIILTIIVFNLIFKRTEKKITGNNRKETLITQNESKKEGITYIKASPTPSPSPKASTKSFFNIFDQKPKPTVKPSPLVSPSHSPSPTPNIKTEENKKVTSTVNVTKGGLKEATQSSELALIENKDGTIFIGTENKDGSKDSFTKKHSSDYIEKIIPPEGFATDVGEFINKLLRLVMMISSLLVFFQLILGGIEWITSGGDKGKVESARGKITAAVIGLIIVASSYAILQLSLNFIGYQSINEIMDLI